MIKARSAGNLALASFSASSALRSRINYQRSEMVCDFTYFICFGQKLKWINRVEEVGQVHCFVNYSADLISIVPGPIRSLPIQKLL